MEKIYFDESFCTIKYDAEQHMIRAEWRGYPVVDRIKQGMEVYLTIMQNHQCTLLLADLTNSKGTFTAANTWMVEDWMPRALKLGYRKCAMVYSKDLFTRFAMDTLNNTYEQASSKVFQMRYFDEERNALQWLTATP